MTDTPLNGVVTARARYAKLAHNRTAVLDRARDCAAVTIPALCPPEGHTQTQKLFAPWQSVGAACVNNLSAKLLTSQFPSELPFFGLVPTQEVRDAFEQAGVNTGDIDSKLARSERVILQDIETSGDRSPLAETIKQLIVTGNVTVNVGEPLRTFRLEQFVVQRDLRGNVVELVVVEGIAYEALDADLQEFVQQDVDCAAKANEGKDIEVYTRVWRDGSRMRQMQEIAGKEIPGSKASWPVELCPWLVLRMVAVPGEDYGRSYVEEYLGDLENLDILERACVEGAQAAAKFIMFVAPNGTTKKDQVAKADNGAVLSGNADDITTFQSQKAMDLNIASTKAADIARRLQFAFLMHTSVQRSGERVTAEEIRTMSEELDATLGGVYTLLTQELQLPYVRVKIARLQKAKKLPDWPKGSLRIAIRTGLDAIGRGRDLQRLDRWLDVPDTLKPQVANAIDPIEFLKRRGAVLALDTEGLLKKPEQMAQEQADQVNDERIAAAIPPAVQAGGRMMQDAMAQEQPTQ